MAEFVGKYKYEKDDGKFDDLLKAMSKYSRICNLYADISSIKNLILI